MLFLGKRYAATVQFFPDGLPENVKIENEIRRKLFSAE
jgi:hypothetical protein